MRQTFNTDDSDFKDIEKINNQNKDSERFRDLDVKDLESKIEYLPITCIPKFNLNGIRSFILSSFLSPKIMPYGLISS
jgi:hypothetical protein